MSKSLSIQIQKKKKKIKKSKTTDDLINQTNIKNEKTLVDKFLQRHKDDLQTKLEKIIDDKFFKKPRKNTQTGLIIKFLKNIDLSIWFRLQDVITDIEKTKIFSDRKRGVAAFFNDKTHGYWITKKVKKDKVLKFDPFIIPNIQQSGTFFNKITSKRVINRAKNRCEVCRNSMIEVKGNIDHIQGRSQGGNGTFENGALLCQQCNNRKKENTVEHFALNYLKDIYKLQKRIQKNITFEEFLNNIQVLNKPID